ncbi:hypothetical protein Hanom_Chr02g00135831 [Helianthus anomalus]
MLVDESEEEDEAEAEGDAEKDQDLVSSETEQILKVIDYELETEKTVGDNEGDDSSSSSSEEEIDETERAKRTQAEVIESQTPPSSGGRKKASARNSVTSPKAARRKLIVRLPKRTPNSKPSQPPSLPPEPSPPQSPHKSPPKQPTPPPSPPPHLSPIHQSPLHLSPIQEQPVVTSQQIFQTPPSTQSPVQSTPGSFGYRDFPHIPGNIPLEDIDDFDFANNEQVKRLEKKVEEVLTDIYILKVKVAELKKEKARRDEQNKYFELKNKELEPAKAMKEHEIYMMNKVLENMLGKSVEQRFEEIEVKEVRARRKAEIDAEMKFKGKGVEGVSDVSERSIVPSTVLESPVQNPRPISAVSCIFEENLLIDDVIDDEEDVDEDDEEEEDDKLEKDDDADDDVFSSSSHSDDDDDDDDDDQGGTSVKVTEASNEQNVDDFLHDDVKEEPEGAEGEGEHVEDQNFDKKEKLNLRLEPEVEEGEIKHTYTTNDIIEMTRIDDPNFKFDFEEELKAFDMNQQPKYQYKYVDEVDNYDRVEVEDCTDEENVNEDTSNFPTLV